MRNKLVEIVKKSLVKNIDYTHRLAENITEDLLAAGVIIQPCKLGEIGYWVTSDGLMPVTFDRIYLSAGNRWNVRARYQCTETVYFSFEHFGKIVFLTIEEAKKALERMNDHGTENH